MAFALGSKLAKRVLASVRWTEQQPKSGGFHLRGGDWAEDPFERVKLSGPLSKGGDAQGTIMTGNPEEGWAEGTQDVTVYEDNMLEAGESIASGKEVHVKWMHGRWVLDDVNCADIS